MLTQMISMQSRLHRVNKVMEFITVNVTKSGILICAGNSFMLNEHERVAYILLHIFCTTE